MGATTIAAIRGNRANRAGRILRCTKLFRLGWQMLVGEELRDLRGIPMPRGRSTFTKRQKEHTRQQRQRDKAERRSQRKQEEVVAGSVDEMAELRKHAAEQAALFNIGTEDTDSAAEPAVGDHISE